MPQYNPHGGKCLIRKFGNWAMVQCEDDTFQITGEWQGRNGRLVILKAKTYNQAMILWVNRDNF